MFFNSRPLAERPDSTVLGGKETSQLPPGFPDKLTGPMTWEGSDFGNDSSAYVCQLTAEDTVEIDDAVKHFQGTKLSRGHISKETFPLSNQLSAKLKQISTAVYAGRGFEVLRGLDPSKYSEEENLVVFVGLSAHVVPQRIGRMDHIFDAVHAQGRKGLKGQVLPPATPHALSFHCDLDGGDVIAMYTQGVAQDGGKQSVCSFWQMYNTLARTTPEVLRVLAEPFPFERKNSETGLQNINWQPIIDSHSGRVGVHFVKSLLYGSAFTPRSQDAPSLTEAQDKAVESLCRACEEHAFELDQAKGDIVFLNNLSTLHARTAFTNYNAGQDRHILRFYVRDPEQTWPGFLHQAGRPLRCSSLSDFEVAPEEQRLETRTEMQAQGFFSPQCHHD